MSNLKLGHITSESVRGGAKRAARLNMSEQERTPTDRFAQYTIVRFVI